MYYISPRSLVQLRERRNRNGVSLFTASAADDVSIKVKNRAGTRSVVDLDRYEKIQFMRCSYEPDKLYLIGKICYHRLWYYG